MSKGEFKGMWQRYRQHWYGRMEPGAVRWNRFQGFYILPRAVDELEQLTRHAALRLRRRCIGCRMRGVHKPDCYHTWRVRDDVHLILRRPWYYLRGKVRHGT